MTSPPSDSNPVKQPDTIARAFPLYSAQLTVAAACLVAAIGHAVFPARIDSTTTAMLALAGAVLFFDRLTKFKGFGIEFEQEVRKELDAIKSHVEEVKDKVGFVQEEISTVQEDVDTLGKTSGPGSRRQAHPMSMNEASADVAVDSDDPNKSMFGNAEVANRRILEAQITPLRGPESALCQVDLQVRSTSPTQSPLTGAVTFYLHPTFGSNAVQKVDVVEGRAQLSLMAYGAFTVGAVADEGETKLELDLVDVKGGTERFRQN